MTEGNTTDSLVMSSDEVALPSTVDGVIRVLRRVLSKPFVQSITLKTGEPIKVVWYKDLTDSLEVGDLEEAPDDVLSRVDLEEFTSSKPPKESLLDAVFYLNQSNLQGTHIFVGSEQFFKDWQGLPNVVAIPQVSGTAYKNYLGLNLIEVTSLERDVVVLLGAGDKGATTTEIVKALKITT